MDTLLETLDRLSSPLGSLLDSALARLAPSTTASACGGNVFCGSRGCSFACGNKRSAEVTVWADSERDCDLGLSHTCVGPCTC